MLLELVDVNTYYSKAHVLQDVSLQVDQGEIITLLGGNGAGKSTTLLTISGVIPPRSGKISFQGTLINREKPAKIVKLGIAQCPEGKDLFPAMNVEDNLKLGAFLRKDFDGIAKDLENIYQRFPILPKRLRQAAGSLSGGEQQMLTIGRALMSRPKLLMLDEPSTGLSPLLTEEIFSIIQDINREGTSILLVEQNVGMALSVAHRGYVLETGKVVFEGTQQELLNNDRVRQAYLGE